MTSNFTGQVTRIVAKPVQRSKPSVLHGLILPFYCCCCGSIVGNVVADLLQAVRVCIVVLCCVA